MANTILNSIFLITFLYFASRIFDDGKAWIWLMTYLVGVFCCGLALLRLYYPTIYVVLLVFVALHGLLLFFMSDGVLAWIWRYRMPSPFFHPDKHRPSSERQAVAATRKFLSLLLFAIALMLNLFR